MFTITKRTKRDSPGSSSAQNLSDTSNSNTTQTQSRRSQRIQNSLLQDDTVGVKQDPASVLLPEVFSEVYKYCSNSDICRFRLVSSSWKNSVQEIWRKRVTIYINKGDTVGSKGTSSLTEFSAAIQNEEFDFSNRPLRRFKFYKFEFILRNYNARSNLGGLLNFCGPTVSHLEISDCTIEDGRQFSHHFLSKFCNIRALILTRLLEPPQMITNKKKRSDEGGSGRENSLLPVFENLSHLKIDYSGFDYDYTNSTRLFQNLLRSTPNLETLEILDCKKVGSLFGFKILDLLQPVEMLSLENKLKKLKHIHISNYTMSLGSKFYDTFKRSIVEQSEALQRSSITLQSLKFDANVKSLGVSVIEQWRWEPDGNEFIETLINKFGTCDLQTLQFSTWKINYPQFPPVVKGMSLKNLTHLSVNEWLGTSIKSAEEMPNLKSLEIWSIPPHTRKARELERNKKYLQHLPADHIVPELADNEDCPSMDHDYFPGDLLTQDDAADCEALESVAPNIPAEDDLHQNDEENNQKPLFWETPNPDGVHFKFLRHFRFEGHSFLPQKFYSLSTWMPNLTSLEIPLTASDFTMVCDQLRSLQRLVLLNTPEHYETIPSSPIDDCAITGKRHSSNTLFVCSCNNFVPRHRRQQSVHLSYFSDIWQPPVKPNITYLQELRHFEMEGLEMSISLDDKFRTVDPENKEAEVACGFHRTYNRNIYLTDESVFDGFYKLPKLTYLNVSAKLSYYTRKELFRRIPKCIIVWPVREEGTKLYYTMQNFEQNNVV